LRIEGIFQIRNPPSAIEKSAIGGAFTSLIGG
jgi:hypothetical protein